MTGLVILLDAVLVAPIFERSYDMFRSAIWDMDSLCPDLHRQFGRRHRSAPLGALT